MNTPRLLLAAVCLWVAVSAARAATNVWDGGGGDSSWQTASNWVSDVVPSSGDDVVINVSSNLTVSSSADVTIKSVQCSNNLAIIAGTFTVLAGTSQITGTLIISNSQLSVNGSTAVLNATGPTSETAGNLFASSGGVLKLPGLVSSAFIAGDTFWQADGAGSLVDMSGLTNVAVLGNRLYARAFNGALVNLSGLRTASGGIDILAQGSNSVVDVSSATDVGSANLFATSGGVVRAMGLRSFSFTAGDTFWQADGAGSLVDMSGLTNVAVLGNRLYVRAFNGALVNLSGLRTASGPINILAEGSNSVVDVSSATDVGSANLFATSGGVVRAMGLRSFSFTAGDTFWQADGAGSLVDMSGLTNVAVLGNRLYVRAFNGALVNLSGLRTASGPINILAEGSNSVVDVSSGTDVGSANLLATSGGVVRAMGLRSFSFTAGDTFWQADGAGSLVDMSGLTNVAVLGNTLYVRAFNGALVNLSGLRTASGPINILAQGSNSVVDVSSGTDVGSANLLANSGGVVRAMGLRSFSFTAGDTFWQADGAGSLVDMSGLTNVAVLGNTLYVRAFNGALVNLSGLRTASGPINILAEGSNSVVDVSSATDVGSANLLANSGGVVRAMGLRSFSFTAGDTFWQADGAGSLVDMSGLTNVAVLGNRLYVRALNGALVNLSGLRTASGPINILAEGSNSVVDVSALTNIQGAVTIETQNGGKILSSSQPFFLTGVTIIIPPAAPIFPPTLIFHGQAWHSYRIEYRNTLQPQNPWLFVTRVPMTNEFLAFAPSLPPNTEFRAFDFVADPPFLDLRRLPAPNVQLVLYGATNKIYALQSTNSLTEAPGDWPVFTTVSMTNAFRFLPPTPATGTQLFFRARENP